MIAYVLIVKDYLTGLWADHAPAYGRDLGQGMIEYALIIGVIVLALIVAYTQTGLGSAIAGVFTDVKAEIS